jgi:hypothetical protein
MPVLAQAADVAAAGEQILAIPRPGFLRPVRD